jgi:hypothetical protein
VKLLSALLLITAGSCSAQFDEGGFPEVLKRAAFEEIIGNYYAFDPFLQTGRKGRELNGAVDELQFSAIEPIFESLPHTNTNEDSTYYSIPPAFTPLESKDKNEFEDSGISVNTRPPVHHDIRQLNDLHSNRPFNFETEFSSFDNEDYPPYPPFLTEQSVRQQQQLSSDVTPEKSLPKYVIGVAGEEGTEDNFFDTKPRSPTVRRQTVYSDQFVRQAHPDATELDESPFARRSLRYVNVEEPPRYNRARFNRRRAAEDIPYSRNIRNGYYVASKVLPLPMENKDSY